LLIILPLAAYPLAELLVHTDGGFVSFEYGRRPKGDGMVDGRMSRKILISAALALLSGCGVLGHPGPSRLISVGVAHITDCAYKGDFVGGAGYDCTLKNFSTSESRDQTDTFCAGYDDKGRMVHGRNRVGSLYNEIMAPQEERIVRIYGPEEATTLVCAETGDILPPTQLSQLMPQLKQVQLVADIDI
jgi:hypothetical protein